MRGEPLGQRDLLTLLATALNAYRVHYLLSGSFASSYYGYPRATHDIDFVVEVGRVQLQPLEKALDSLGKGFRITASELKRVSSPQMVSSYHDTTGIKIDFWITDAADFALKYTRRRSMTIDRTRIPLISPEDLILTKLSWCKELRSERHMQDCVGIWRVQKGKLDEVYLSKRARELDIAEFLREATTTSFAET